MTLSEAERKARLRAQQAAEGRKPIHVVLTPAAADKLARWVTRGLTVTQVVNKLLERSKP